jgi:disulfide bond formation protein DsbB
MTQPDRSDLSSVAAPVLVFFGGLVFVLVAMLAGRPAGGTQISLAPTPVVIAAPAAAALLDPAVVSAGGNLFQSVCAACHGFNARGISGLGKPLIENVFVNGLSDEELLAFLNIGREVTDPLNTTGVLMPAKGGNPTLNDEDLHSIIAYIRSLNGREVAAESANPVEVAAGPTAEPIEFRPLDVNALQLVTANENSASSSTSSGFTAPGALDYQRACAGCHAADGSGQYRLAKPLTESAILQNQNSFALLDLLSKPLPPMNPYVGFQHPYRAGYPELTNEQLLGIYTYLLTLGR